MDEEYDNVTPPVMSQDTTDATIGDLIKRLEQERATPAQGYPTPVIQGYPHENSDAPTARAYGFGYGSPLDALVQGRVRQYTGATEGQVQDYVKSSRDVPESARMPTARSYFYDMVADSKDEGIKALNGIFRDKTAAEALLINRMPIATYGFSPQALRYDTRQGGGSLHGFYNPNNDVLYATPEPDTLAHESTHRGIELMRSDPIAGALIKSMGQLDPAGPAQNDESITRFILGQHAPELAHNKLGSNTYIDNANAAMKNPVMMNMLKQLEERAQQLIAQRNPRGPR